MDSNSTVVVTKTAQIIALNFKNGRFHLNKGFKWFIVY